jgi:hypothetical protein
VARRSKAHLAVGAPGLARVLVGGIINAPMTLAAEPSGWDVGATAVSGPRQAPESYFSFNLLPGQSTTGAVLVVADYPYYGPGWNITMAATPLSSGSNSLPAVPSWYAVNGSVTTASATATLSRSCTGSGSVAPTGNSVKYPLVLTASPQILYTAAVDTGEGTCTLNTDWWLVVPANTYAGTYTGTVTLTLTSGP